MLVRNSLTHVQLANHEISYKAIQNNCHVTCTIAKCQHKESPMQLLHIQLQYSHMVHAWNMNSKHIVLGCLNCDAYVVLAGFYSCWWTCAWQRASDLSVVGCQLLLAVTITAYPLTIVIALHQGGKSKQLAIRLVYWQISVTCSGIVHMYIYILYLRHEDAILVILCSSLPIAMAYAGKWLNCLVFHDNIKCLQLYSLLSADKINVTHHVKFATIH